MTHLVFTQNIKVTQYQKNKIKEIFTPDYIIETSKVISIMHEQDSVIKVRDIQIKELEYKISELKKIHLKSIANLKSINNNLNSAIDLNNTKLTQQLKLERKKYLGFHSYAGLNISKLQLDNINISGELLYRFPSITIGIGLELTNPVYVDKYFFNYFIEIRYKIF